MNPELNQNQINNINQQIQAINQGLGGVNQQQGTNLQNLPTLSLGQPNQVNMPNASNGFGTNIAPQQSQLEQMVLDRFNESQNFNPDQIRSNALSMFQPQIDAINQLYSGLISQAQTEGRGRLGSQRAIASRGGLIGSQRGETQVEQVKDFNRQVVSSIEAQRSNEIASIMGQANRVAQEELQQRTEAARRGADEYMQFLSQREERQRNNASAVMNSLIQQGLSVDDLDDNQIQTLSSQLGYAPDELRNIYQGAFLQATAQEVESFTLSEGQRRFVVNPETGEIEQVAFNPKSKAGGGEGSTSERMAQINWANELIRLNPDADSGQLRQVILENAPGISVTLLNQMFDNVTKPMTTLPQLKQKFTEAATTYQQGGFPADWAAAQFISQLSQAKGVQPKALSDNDTDVIKDILKQVYGLNNRRANNIIKDLTK
jgi:hypothetical protein